MQIHCINCGHLLHPPFPDRAAMCRDCQQSAPVGAADMLALLNSLPDPDTHGAAFDAELKRRMGELFQ